jgi:hypothetical protein
MRETFPPAAVAGSVQASIEHEPEHVPNLPFGELAVGPAATFGPRAESFQGEVELTLPFDPLLLPAGTTAADLHVWAYDQAGWHSLAPSSVAADRVTVQVTTLGMNPFVPAATLPLVPGELRIDSSPAFATVYLDGFDTDLRTPTSVFDVLPGDHGLKLYLPGFNELFTTASVAPSGSAAGFVLAKTEGNQPEIALPSIQEGLVVFDSLLEVGGFVTLDAAPLRTGLVVLSLNGKDQLTPLEPDGSFSDFVSLLPGENQLQVRVNSPEGITGATPTLTITNGERGLPLPVAGSFITITLTWDTNDTDVDLHVFDPLGNHAWYAGLDGIPGAMLDNDDVDGFGPEIFTFPDPISGTYHVNVDYFDDNGHGPTTASLKISIGEDEIFSDSYLFTQDDQDVTGGQPAGASPAAFWEAHTFTIDELAILSLKAAAKSTQDDAIFTTALDENTIHVTTKAPSDVPEAQLHYRIREAVEDFPLQVEDLSGHEVDFFAEHEPLLDLAQPPQSHRLEYEVVAFVLDDLGIETQTSSPAFIRQDVRSRVRQEYVDKRDLEGSAFTVATPGHGQVIDAGGFPAGIVSFTFAEFSQWSEFPGLAVVDHAPLIAQQLRDAWGFPLLVTSGWRNPRRNDSPQVGGVLNSLHQTGNAIDLNPLSDPAQWPAGVGSFAQAQQKLAILAQQLFDPATHDVVFHANHLHVEFQP